jgi:nicotinamide mononucleotide (NMN) deamidase PncC
MAENVCRLFNADWGIGITGYASPLSKGDGDGMQLYALYSIAFKGKKIKTEAIIAVPGRIF